MKIVRGTSIDNPIVVKKSELDLNLMRLSVDSKDDAPPIYGSSSVFHSILDAMFGPFDGSYFIINEVELINENSRYKVYYVEDKDAERHSVFFKIDK